MSMNSYPLGADAFSDLDPITESPLEDEIADYAEELAGSGVMQSFYQIYLANAFDTDLGEGILAGEARQEHVLRALALAHAIGYSNGLKANEKKVKEK